MSFGYNNFGKTKEDKMSSDDWFASIRPDKKVDKTAIRQKRSSGKAIPPKSRRNSRNTRQRDDDDDEDNDNSFPKFAEMMGDIWIALRRKYETPNVVGRE